MLFPRRVRISGKAVLLLGVGLILGAVLTMCILGAFTTTQYSLLGYTGDFLTGAERIPRAAMLTSPKSPLQPPRVPSEATKPSVTGEAEAGWVLTTRMLIREGYLRLRVGREKVEKVAEQVANIAVSLGGYVAQMTVYEDKARVVVRVPFDKFDEAMRSLKTLGEVVEASTYAQDVTEEYVDLNARLAALKQVEARLLALLERAQTVEEILKVEDYLKRIRVEIERIEARIKYLERRVEYSTIRVDIEAPPKEVKPIVMFPSFDPLPALAEGLKLMYNIVYAVIVLVIAMVPLAALSVVCYLAYKYLGKRIKRHSEAKAT